MSLLIVSAISLSGIFIGKVILKKWVNHLSVYSIIWGVMILLYELKLLPYPSIVPLAWFVIFSAFFSFFLGILTIIAARGLYSKQDPILEKEEISLNLFSDNGKVLKYAIFFFGFIALLAAIQNWIVLFQMYGSIAGIFLNAVKIYKSTTTGGLKGVFPYISHIGFVAVFLSGIYSAYRGKVTFLTFFPFIGIVLKDLAIFGRGATLLAFLEFLFSFSLFRHLLNKDSLNKYKFSRINVIVSSTILLVFLIVSVSLVKVSRSGGEEYAGQSRSFNELKSNMFLSPSVYLYLSSDVGVLSEYFSSLGEDAQFGENTFLPFYALLSKFEIVRKPNHYQKGYYIPIWTNNATYIRELHADFGVPGIFLGPYLIGLLTTWLWFRFYQSKSLFVFTLLVYFYLITGFSFLIMVTRLAHWLLSLLFILLCLPVLEKLALIKK